MPRACSAGSGSGSHRSIRSPPCANLCSRYRASSRIAWPGATRAAATSVWAGKEPVQHPRVWVSGLFESRGFRVVHAYPLQPDAGQEGGEVDLICALDSTVLVLEVKSTFLRATQKEAWFHAATTLRKAGLQVKRNVAAVGRALDDDAALRTGLGLEHSQRPPQIIGWIVDTSIENDHERFGGFLKVSIEEVLIALRDDRHLLKDLAKEMSEFVSKSGSASGPIGDEASSLYPAGFTAERFVEVIEGEAIWEKAGIDT